MQRPVRARSLLFIVTLLCVFTEVFCAEKISASEPLLKIETKQKTYLGKEVVHNDQQCWLYQRDGRLETFLFDDVTGFKRVASRFKPFSKAEMRSHLLVEFGKKMEVVGTKNYLICAAPGHGKKYGELFEQLYRECHIYFATRGFKIKSPEFPLVAIVFSSHAQFVKYARAEGITNTNGLAGYYQTHSNRIAFFDPATAVQTAQLPPEIKNSTDSSISDHLLGKVSSTSKTLQETLIHEGTHQIAFNLGLHSRIAEMPRWIVEGLATVFEHPDSRSASKSGSASQRINKERFIWFGNFAKKRRDNHSLESFIASDQMFRTQTLDAYSQAWALSFFLMETRPVQYAKYLKTVAQRPMLGSYPPPERLKDFHNNFGTAGKMNLFEAEFLRFIQKL